MSLAVDDTDTDQAKQAELAGLVYRFWLTFIQHITEPHLQDSGGDKQLNLMERQLAETVEKAVD